MYSQSQPTGGHPPKSPFVKGDFFRGKSKSLYSYEIILHVLGLFPLRKGGQRGLHLLSQILLHYLNFLLGQIVQLVHQAVNGLDLALEDGFGLRGFGAGELFVQLQHALHQGDHLVVAGFVSGVQVVASIKFNNFEELN